MNPYDIERIFREIEEEIIGKMIDNFRKIRAKGKQGEYNWQEWRLKQLKAIKKFIKSIKGDYEDTYKELNDAVSDNIEKSFDDTLVQDIEQAVESTETDRFSYINRTRMEALQKATTDDLQRVESAVFRKAEDEYRQIVYKAQVALNSGTVTYDQAVDMATRDLLNAGINCVVYKNGARHTVKDYASMVLRTTMKRASLMAEGEMRTQSGVHTVYAKFREEACPLCLPWLGRLMVDDVYSVGTREEADELGAYLLSEAMRWGFLHPNCKDTVATYYPYLWEDDPEHDPLKIHANKRMEYEAIQRQKIEDKLSNAKVNVEKYTRRADNSLSPLNRRQAEARRDEWQGRQVALEQQVRRIDRNTLFRTGRIQGLGGSERVDKQWESVRNAQIKPLNEIATTEEIEELKESVSTYLPNASEKWNDLLEDFAIGNSEFDGVGFFDKNTGVHINWANASLEERIHELAHEFDYLLGSGEYISDRDNIIGLLIHKESYDSLKAFADIRGLSMLSYREARQSLIENIMNGYGISEKNASILFRDRVYTMLKSYVPEEVVKEFREFMVQHYSEEELIWLSDMFSSVMPSGFERPFYNYGHSDGYWEHSSNVEGWAILFGVIGSNNMIRLNAIKEFYPHTVNYFIKRRF